MSHFILVFLWQSLVEVPSLYIWNAGNLYKILSSFIKQIKQTNKYINQSIIQSINQ